MALLTLEICSVMIYLNKGDFSLYARNIVLTIVNNADGTILNVKNGDMLTVQKGMEIMMGSTKTVVQ